MSDISGINGNQPINRTAGVKITPRTPIDQPASVDRLADRVEISNVSPLLAKLRINDIRTDKVADIKAQIEAGKYESPDKIDAAVNALLDELD